MEESPTAHRRWRTVWWLQQEATATGKDAGWPVWTCWDGDARDARKNGVKGKNVTTQEHLLDELRYEYSEGRLVPFLGSGMSWPVCRLWADMIGQLERVGGLRSLTRRAARVLERLRLEGGMDQVVAAVRDALLKSGPAPPPASTATLARLHWPLVLTTNYDDLYVAAAHEKFLRKRIGKRRHTSEAERRTPPLEVVGRSPSDCYRELSALRGPASSDVALQGFQPGAGADRDPARRRARHPALAGLRIDQGRAPGVPTGETSAPNQRQNDAIIFVALFLLPGPRE